ncbi:Cytochrome c-type biogenesis protein CcmI [Candidatus Propionivibrio aalborgensis]|uniref:Cytochrome c-type biogenesis protein CcmI n=1 Tax=Candidatus Propionivibrio aalborgensis TaxID=1860101 RepID=A0A1A8XJU2_9RHOO|nr:c-type cytochrome biogenesis protein CcmI [Candidatus Propionivibrio aalborgensis]SBT04213.1 Cytochrome c-type biogenesis protein CcmI [Candidatus Propionivibrio aalborgensis]
MTSTTGFILASALLVLVVLGILLLPLWRTPKPAKTVNRGEANLDIFRDQMRELERDHDEGILTDADLKQAKSELQRRLLDEVHPETVPQAKSGGRQTALALLIALPLAATAGYLILGNPQALDPTQTQTQTQTQIGPQQIEAMLGKLVEKLKQNPDDTKGWVMLARSYKVLGRFSESAEAYSHGGALVDADPSLLADYAEVLAQANGGSLAGQPDKLLSRALEIDPNEPQALFLAGAAASERRDFSAVARYWERLLQQLEPGSEEAQSLELAVAKAREIDAQSGGKPPGITTTGPNAIPAESISGVVTISSKIAAQAKPGDLLFVFARAEEGSRMPLAVVRAQLADLPLKFRFDDSMALPGGKKISGFKTVSVEARVAKAGKAQSSSGDLFGSIKGVKPGSKNIKLVIDQIQP